MVEMIIYKVLQFPQERRSICLLPRLLGGIGHREPLIGILRLIVLIVSGLPVAVHGIEHIEPVSCGVLPYREILADPSLVVSCHTGKSLPFKVRFASW